ncbi:MAG: UvrD-helicase domain-containing protein, partial [Clostridia bacterium]|nr:UvrD-helicase domain-containing protein [Clostridia bacterium]
MLAITFTNKAADEMKERLVGQVGSIEDMWVCTIHSMCVRILRYTAEKIGYGRDFSIYSDTDKEKVIKRVAQSLNIE